MIPRILHRCVPAHVPDPYSGWWQRWLDLHPEWQTRTWVNGEDAELFPETSPLWERCRSGAQLADLVRLEAIWRWGGVYVDWDFEPFRTIEELRHVPQGVFFGSEDGHWLANAFFGAEPGHPVIRDLLDAALRADLSVAPNVSTGPHMLTRVLGHRRDEFWQVPKELLFPVPFDPSPAARERVRRERGKMTFDPVPYAVHWWSWTWKGL